MSTTRSEWVTQVLSDACGITHPSSQTGMLIWTVAESTNEPCDGQRGAKNNPINTTLEEPGVTPYNTFGVGLHVWNYPTLTEGVEATVKTLEQANMGLILTALKEGRSVGYILARIASSPWGTGSAVWGALTRYEADPSGYQRLYVGEPGQAPAPPPEAGPFPAKAWRWAWWVFTGRHGARPNVPAHIPVTWWKLIAWYQRHAKR